MDRVALLALLDDVAGGSVDPRVAMAVLARPAEDLGFTRIDHDRPARTGEPEVVFGEGKTPAQVAGVFRELLAAGTAPVLATRCTAEHARATPDAEYDPVSRLLVARRAAPDPSVGTVVVASAGTSDGRIVAEAVGTLQAFGVDCDVVADVGVAGVHRVLAERDRLAAARACIVVAGMEAALPAIVAGLTPAPIVAVPTSVGYGASFGGLAALLGMLTSCAPGVSVVNIDNGFGAALVARRILRAAVR